MNVDFFFLQRLTFIVLQLVMMLCVFKTFKRLKHTSVSWPDWDLEDGNTNKLLVRSGWLVPFFFFKLLA